MFLLSFWFGFGTFFSHSSGKLRLKRLEEKEVSPGKEKECGQKVWYVLLYLYDLYAPLYLLLGA